jgi:hypothetical protein
MKASEARLLEVWSDCSIRHPKATDPYWVVYSRPDHKEEIGYGASRELAIEDAIHRLPATEEPAPKEGEDTFSEIFDGKFAAVFADPRMDDNYAEPAKVEAGDGLPTVKLPPIEDTFGLGAVPVAEALRQRTDQLKASLEREGRLRDLVNRVYLSTASGFGDGHIRISLRLDLFKEIEAVVVKAAVTGE